MNIEGAGVSGVVNLGHWRSFVVGLLPHYFGTLREYVNTK